MTLSDNPETDVLLRVEDLLVEFRTSRGTARVLDNINLTISKGETLGIVGESGCGKSMTALSILGLVPQPPGRIAGGKVLLKGEDLLKISEEAMEKIRGNEISMIFQEPMTSLNPVFTIGEQIAEAIRFHRKWSRKRSRERALEMLKSVGIPLPERRMKEYPFQLSGGMRQRVMIAIALACNPSILIADEPTTALDVTVQAQIFDLLEDIQKNTQTAIILITHDMGVIAEMASRVVVMYAGRIIEEGLVKAVLDAPKHPYTQGLVECVPQIDPDPKPERSPLAEIPGVVPALTDLGAGCAFAPRCQYAKEKCRQSAPPNFATDSAHQVACWLYAGEEK